MKNGNLIVKLENDKGVDDYEKSKWTNTRPSHFGSCNLSLSKRLMSDVIRKNGGFYSNSI